MDPLNLLVARQNAADQVRETVAGGPGDASTKDAKLGPVVHVGWWRRLQEITRAATRRRVTVLR